jgi:hypothetical protein
MEGTVKGQTGLEIHGRVIPGCSIHLLSAIQPYSSGGERSPYKSGDGGSKPSTAKEN